MAKGLRYETGRDMPPGMAEKVAIQRVRQLEVEALAQRSEQSPAAESKVSVDGSE